MPQDALPDLAGYPPRELVDQLNQARSLELREPVGAVFVDHLDTQAWSGDKCHNLLAGTPVGPADHSHRLNTWQLGDRFLDFGRVDVEAIHDDQLASPVDQKQLAVELVTDIASREPAELAWTTTTVRPVAGKQVVTADPDLAWFGRFGAVADSDLDAG